MSYSSSQRQEVHLLPSGFIRQPMHAFKGAILLSSIWEFAAIESGSSWSSSWLHAGSSWISYDDCLYLALCACSLAFWNTSSPLPLPLSLSSPFAIGIFKDFIMISVTSGASSSMTSRGLYSIAVFNYSAAFLSFVILTASLRFFFILHYLMVSLIDSVIRMPNAKTIFATITMMITIPIC